MFRSVNDKKISSLCCLKNTTIHVSGLNLVLNSYIDVHQCDEITGKKNASKHLQRNFNYTPIIKASCTSSTQLNNTVYPN